MTRRYTILSDCSNYGDGITQGEADAMAEAEKAAVLRRFPDAEVRVMCAVGSMRASNDADIDEWAEAIWNSILEQGGNGGYVPTVIDRWNAAASEEVAT